MESPGCEWCPKCVLTLPEQELGEHLQRVMNLLPQWDRALCASPEAEDRVTELIQSWQDYLRDPAVLVQAARCGGVLALVDLAASDRPFVASRAFCLLTLVFCSDGPLTPRPGQVAVLLKALPEGKDLWTMAIHVVKGGRLSDRHAATGLVQALGSRHAQEVRSAVPRPAVGEMLRALCASHGLFTAEAIASEGKLEGWAWGDELLNNARRQGSTKEWVARYASHASEGVIAAISATLWATCDADGAGGALEAVQAAPEVVPLLARCVAEERATPFLATDLPYLSALGLASLLSRRGAGVTPFVDDASPSAAVAKHIVAANPGLVEGLTALVARLTTPLMTDGAVKKSAPHRGFDGASAKKALMQVNGKRSDAESSRLQSVHRTFLVPITVMHCIAGIASVRELCPSLKPFSQVLWRLAARGDALRKKKNEPEEFHIMCGLGDFLAFSAETDSLAGPLLEEVLLIIGRLKACDSCEPPASPEAAALDVPALAKARAQFVVTKLSDAKTKPRFAHVARQIAEMWFPGEDLGLEVVGSSDEKCPMCGKKGDQRCSRCKKVVYCSRECQKAHWSKHKPLCKAN